MAVVFKEDGVRFLRKMTQVGGGGEKGGGRQVKQTIF
jgi:hypothetical protein